MLWYGQNKRSYLSQTEQTENITGIACHHFAEPADIRIGGVNDKYGAKKGNEKEIDGEGDIAHAAAVSERFGQVVNILSGQLQFVFIRFCDAIHIGQKQFLDIISRDGIGFAVEQSGNGIAHSNQDAVNFFERRVFDFASEKSVDGGDREVSLIGYLLIGHAGFFFQSMKDVEDFFKHKIVTNLWNY